MAHQSNEGLFHLSAVQRGRGGVRRKSGDRAPGRKMGRAQAPRKGIDGDLFRLVGPRFVPRGFTRQTRPATAVAAPTMMVGEVDTYKKFADYDLYGDFNVNYVKLDRVPDFDDWSAINRALRGGEFFVTTGEVLIPRWSVKGRGDKREVVAHVE